MQLLHYILNQYLYQNGETSNTVPTYNPVIPAKTTVAYFHLPAMPIHVTTESTHIAKKDLELRSEEDVVLGIKSERNVVKWTDEV